jgi:hypothetical protein
VGWRPLSSGAWSFGTKRICGSGDYVAMAKRLCVLAGKPDVFSDVVDHVDIEHSEFG